MPVFLLLAGVLLMVLAVRGNTTYAINLLKEDVLGTNGFIMWTLAVIIVVSLGNIKSIKPVSDAFLGLIILVIIVYSYKNNSNFFTNFTTQIKEGVSSNGNCGTTPTATIPGNSGGGILDWGASEVQGGVNIAALGG